MKKNIYLFYLMFLFEGMVFYAPIATLYRAAVGISIFQITIIESICSACCLLLEVPWGKIADRIGYRRTMIISSIFYFGSKIIFWKADCFGEFLLERIFLAIAISGMSGCDSAIIYLSCDEEESQKVFSICGNMGTIGMLFAAGVYTTVIGENYRLAGLLTVITYGIGLLLCFGLKEVKEKTKESKQEDNQNQKMLLKMLFEDKNYLMFLIGVALLDEVHQTVTTFLCQLQYQRCGISNYGMGKIFILLTLAGLVGVFSTRLTRNLGRRGFTNLMYGLASMACLLMAMTKNPFLTIVCVVALRMASSLVGPLQSVIQNEVIKVENRATMLSINAMFMDCISIGTNIIFGKIADVSLVGSLICSAITCLIGGILVNKIQM